MREKEHVVMTCKETDKVDITHPFKSRVYDGIRYIPKEIADVNRRAIEDEFQRLDANQKKVRDNDKNSGL